MRTLTTLALGVAALAPLPTFAQAPHPVAQTLQQHEAETGTLLLPSGTPGRFIPAPTLGTDVLIAVSGPIARTTLTQRFTNPSDQWVEGVYVFPLPDTASVDGLKLIVGDRLIEGQIQEKQHARALYDAAKAAGQTAALTQQQRPNLFTNSVANIGPGETVTIQITYGETVAMQADHFALRFPMVAAPRYTPAPTTLHTVSLDTTTTGFTNIVQSVPVTAPVAHPDAGPINPVTLRVDLDAGFPVGTLDSPSHPLSYTSDADDTYAITLDGDAYADRDFVLEWSPQSGTTPSAGLFTETVDQTDYHLLTLTPPSDAPVLATARDVTFILDVSGSMAGESIRQAKAGLAHAIDALGPDDRFNIVAFDDRTYPMWPGLRTATTSNLARASRWLARTHGGGGTEMLPALELALSQQDDDPTRLAQIIFLTDGAIGNEAALFSTIADRRGDARVFTVGMGSAPNTHFMRRAAELGRGTHTHIGNVAEAASRMDALTTRLTHPVMTDIALRWPDGTTLDANPVPDLYAGDTLHVTASLPAGAGGTLVVTGRQGADAFQTSIPIPVAPASRPGVSKLWARERLANLELERLSNPLRADRIDADILRTALDFGLVSRHTSLVAVDVTPRRPDGTPLHAAAVPANLPKGWDFGAVFGDAPPTRHGALAPPLDREAALAPTTQVDLPQGSTPALLSTLLGLLLLLGAAVRTRRTA